MITRLHEIESEVGAEFTERDGVATPLSFGSPVDEYKEIADGAALFDLSWFGALSVTGRDRAAWLHKLTTANVEALRPGSCTHALLLNATGHVVADFMLVVQDGELLLYSGRAAIVGLAAALKRSIFREKVTLQDLTQKRLVLSLQGRRAGEVLGTAFYIELSNESHAFLLTTDTIAANCPRARGIGWDLIVPAPEAANLWSKLLAAGARPAGLDALRAARIEAGIPWFGDDFDQAMLAPEARLDALIGKDKGCYTGQEVIARINTRGHVNRLLCKIQVRGDIPVSRGDVIAANEREIGWITSTPGPMHKNVPFALGYLRREHTDTGTAFTIIHDDRPIEGSVAGPAMAQ